MVRERPRPALSTSLGLRPLGIVRPLEDLIDLLVRAGAADSDALSAVRLFLGFLNGHVLNEVQELVDDPDEADDLLRLGLYRLPARQFPRLRSLADYNGAIASDLGLIPVRPDAVRPIQQPSNVPTTHPSGGST